MVKKVLLSVESEANYKKLIRTTMSKHKTEISFKEGREFVLW